MRRIAYVIESIGADEQSQFSFELDMEARFAHRKNLLRLLEQNRHSEAELQASREYWEAQRIAMANDRARSANRTGNKRDSRRRVNRWRHQYRRDEVRCAHQLKQFREDLDLADAMADAIDAWFDDFDAMFGQMIDDGEAELVMEDSDEVIVFNDGILIWMANGSCCFCDKFEFSSKNQMQAAAA